MKGTTSKDDAGNSKTSDSSVEDAAPLWEEGDSQEGIVYHYPFSQNRGGARAVSLWDEIHDFPEFALFSMFLYGVFHLYG